MSHAPHWPLDVVLRRFISSTWSSASSLKKLGYDDPVSASTGPRHGLWGLGQGIWLDIPFEAFPLPQVKLWQFWNLRTKLGVELGDEEGFYDVSEVGPCIDWTIYANWWCLSRLLHLIQESKPWGSVDLSLTSPSSGNYRYCSLISKQDGRPLLHCPGHMVLFQQQMFMEVSLCQWSHLQQLSGLETGLHLCGIC